jgi:hypothetical protein
MDIIFNLNDINIISHGQMFALDMEKKNSC